VEVTLKASDIDLLRALRARAGCGLEGLAASLGLPRTNFGRRPSRRVSEQMSRLVAHGLVEQNGCRYRLTEQGRRVLGDHAFNSVR
jgi:DNA-binding IclR family transcriptional regulator